MRDKRIYYLRQAILKAAKAYYPAPFTENDLEGHHHFILLRASRAEVCEELEGLILHGYIRRIEGSYSILADKGQLQIDRERDPDVYVWGELGLR